jgi:hypothetical protein
MIASTSRRPESSGSPGTVRRSTIPCAPAASMNGAEPPLTTVAISDPWPA